jgi:hypothetical protein
MRKRLAAAAIILAMALPALARTQPAAMADAEFWRLVTELSEPGGVFAPQLMSNEDSAQFVMPALATGIAKGGVYLGVGPEQNFTYLSELGASLAFVVDIRRDNMLELLMYKALFELSADRAEFVSRLFARLRPGGLTGASSVTALFDAYRAAAPDATLFERNVTGVLDLLTRTHGFALSEGDQAAIRRMLSTFRTAGPDALQGYGDGMRLTYAQLMAAGDEEGRPHGFLATEERYLVVRTLQVRNLIVPVVGDFAGEKAIAGIARELKTRGLAVDVFYLSNVERYLWERSDRGRPFYANVAALPRTNSTTFIRSVTTDISVRLGIPIPPGPARWRTFLSPVNECLARIADGRIQSYRDLFGPR